MSEIWSVIPEEVVSREPSPRILKEIQDITGKLYQEFAASGEPITDDNQVLHRLCVKLEYLLQTCMRQKSLLGGDRHYWHWMYDSLKRAKGLSDGLKFVRGNKELRTSQGRGRALIRYSLVHQTLADSFQNCLMNRSTCSQYLKPMCVLTRSNHSAVFLNALYEMNAVNFDLISKGYDLDTAWPTFASKRHTSGPDQWRLPSDRTGSFGSLGSYVSHITSVSMLPENRSTRGLQNLNGVDADCRGTVSSGPPSVDHRVEELVLELSESDQKIQEQEEALKRLESEANLAAKSASERQDILARVISDLESRNQSLQNAMGQMSTEFQNREQTWEMKYNELKKKTEETEGISLKLKSKVAVLEEDKRNLEDTVSARMTRITSGFSGTTTDLSASSAGDIEYEYEFAQKCEAWKDEKQQLEENIKSLRLDLAAVPGRIESEKQALILSLSAEFETRETEWKCKIESASHAALDTVIGRLSSVLPHDGMPHSVNSSQETVKIFENKIKELVNEVSELRRVSSKLQEERLVQTSREEEIESRSSNLIEKLDSVKAERDNALFEVKEMSGQILSLNKELQNLKLKHEAEVSTHQQNMLAVKESNFYLQESVKKEEMSNKTLQTEIEFLQQKFSDASVDLKSFKQDQYAKRKDESESEELREKSKRIKDLEGTIACLENQTSEKEKLHDLCIQENEKLEKQVTDSNSTITQLQGDIAHYTSTIQTLQQEKLKLSEELVTERSNVLLHSQKNLQLSSVITNMTEAFENTERQYQLLNENLSKKDNESAEFQMSAIKTCIETERAVAKKEYDELAGENESRKRMILSLENKLQSAKEENAKMSKAAKNLEEIETSLQQALADKEEFERLYNETEQNTISVAEKLETERENSMQLKKEISEGLQREEDLKKDMKELETVSSALKAKLIQLVQEKDALWKELDELKYFQKLQEDGDETEARWMEDQEARYCLHCGIEFSIIVRKHHCRVCGKIFCNKCSKQWIKSNDGKLERCCLACLDRHRNANVVKALTDSIPSPSKSSPAKGNKLSANDSDFDTITDEELGHSKNIENSPSSSVADSSSLYVTANAHHSSHSSDSVASIPLDEDNEEIEVSISAGDFLRLPVSIEARGTVISWKFSCDRSIDFQVSYRGDVSDSDENILFPKQRYDAHSEPVQDQIITNDQGVYIFEFDNRFSRIMSKSIKYCIKVKKSD